MKIKIIDLLIKIANGEKVPNKIKFWNNIWEYRKDGRMLDYINDDKCLMEYVAINKDGLNQDVEIIEEPKKIEKIEMVGCNVRVPTLNNELVGTDTPLALETTIVKINELIDEINNLKRKKDE